MGIIRIHGPAVLPEVGCSKLRPLPNAAVSEAITGRAVALGRIGGSEIRPQNHFPAKPLQTLNLPLEKPVEAAPRSGLLAELESRRKPETNGFGTEGC